MDELAIVLPVPLTDTPVIELVLLFNAEAEALNQELDYVGAFLVLSRLI